MAWLPTVRALVDRVATPPERVAGLPRFTPPSLNWTVPPGVPAPGGTAVTVALKVTFWVTTEGLSEEPIEVAVPPKRVTGLPRLTPSTPNWTVPVSEPVPVPTWATVAVKLTP